MSAIVTTLGLLLASCTAADPEAGSQNSTPTEPQSSQPSSPTPSPEPTAQTEQTAEPSLIAAVSSQQAATDVAQNILESGGNAADAAVGAASMLSVVEPYYSNILGGETSALYYDGATGEVTSLEGVGTIGSNFTIDSFANRSTTYGMHQVLVPGAWDGWMLWMEEFGSMDLSDILAPAVAAARDGIQVSPELELEVATALGRGAVNQAGQQIFVPNGVPVRQGDTLIQSDFANTLQAISDEYTQTLASADRSTALEAARNYVYAGPVAAEMVAASDADNGYLTAEDFSTFESQLKEPLSLDYTDEITVFQSPPTSQGISMLSGLNTIKAANISQYPQDSAESLQVQLEAIKLAMVDLNAYVGDPDFNDVPVEELLTPEYGAQQAQRISQNSSLTWPISAGLPQENTTTLQFVDQYGNAASVTTSIGLQFIVAGNTGVTMNNRVRYMSMDPSSPNYVEAGKKVRYTGNPYLATRNEDLYMLGGNVGADMQPQAQIQQFISVVEYGMGAQAAIDRFRYRAETFPNAIAPNSVSNLIRIEPNMPTALVEGLRAKGQPVDVNSIIGYYGIASMIIVSEDGRTGEFGIDGRTSDPGGFLTPAP